MTYLYSIDDTVAGVARGSGDFPAFFFPISLVSATWDLAVSKDIG